MHNNYGLSLIVPIGIENDENKQALFRLENLILLYLESKLHNTELIISECGSSGFYKTLIFELCSKYKITYNTCNEQIFLSGHARNQGALIAKYSYLGFIDIDLRFSTDLFKKIFMYIDRLNMNDNKKRFFSIPVFYLTKDYSIKLLQSDNYNEDINNLYSKYINGDCKNSIEYYSPVSSFLIINKYHFFSIGGNDLDYKGHGFEDFDLLYRLIDEEGIIPKPKNHLLDTRVWEINNYEGLRAYFYAKSLFDKCLKENIFIIHLWHNRPKNTSFYRKNKNRQIYKDKFTHFDNTKIHPLQLSYKQNNILLLGNENDINIFKDIILHLGQVKLLTNNDLNNYISNINSSNVTHTIFIDIKHYQEIYQYANKYNLNYFVIKKIDNNSYKIYSNLNQKNIKKSLYVKHNNSYYFYKLIIDDKMLYNNTKPNIKQITMNKETIEKLKYDLKQIEATHENTIINNKHFIYTNNLIINSINNSKCNNLKVLFNNFKKNPYMFLKKIFQRKYK